jgi:hypothetical protein
MFELFGVMKQILAIKVQRRLFSLWQSSAQRSCSHRFWFVFLAKEKNERMLRFTKPDFIPKYGRLALILML